MAKCEDEAVLINRCRRGARNAFEPIVAAYMKDSYYIAFGLLGNHDDALDISQEAFVRAYRNIGQLRDGRKFFPWFYQILRNLCFSHLRKVKIRKTMNRENIESAHVVQCDSEKFDPKAIVQKQESHRELWEAIGRLAPKHREVIILRHFRGMSYNKITENLGVSRGTVMSRLHHARTNLREILDRKEGRSIT